MRKENVLPLVLDKKIDTALNWDVYWKKSKNMNGVIIVNETNSWNGSKKWKPK